MINVLGPLFKILLVFIERWVERQEEKKQMEYQDGRKDIVEGNVDAVAARIDRLLKAAADSRVER